MKINIKAKNFELTPAIKGYVEEKMSYLDRLMGDIDILGAVSLDFEVGKTTMHHNKGGVFYAEANLHVPKRTIRAAKTDDDLHAAIDEVKEVLAREVKEYKERSGL